MSAFSSGTSRAPASFRWCSFGKRWSRRPSSAPRVETPRPRRPRWAIGVRHQPSARERNGRRGQSADRGPRSATRCSDPRSRNRRAPGRRGPSADRGHRSATRCSDPQSRNRRAPGHRSQGIASPEIIGSRSRRPRASGAGVARPHRRRRAQTSSPVRRRRAIRRPAAKGSAGGDAVGAGDVAVRPLPLPPRRGEWHGSYITTAIDYANGDPHMGHAFEKLGADCIARYRRLRGDEVWFLIGMDEHGQKVAQTAAERGLTPQALTDEVAAGVSAHLGSSSGSRNDQFIRTTAQAAQGRGPRPDRTDLRTQSRRFLRKGLPRALLRRL